MELSRIETVLTFYSPVWSAMQGMLDFRDTVLLSMTCKSMNRLVRRKLSKYLKVDDYLASYCSTPSQLLMLLRISGGVIFDAAAARYFLGQTAPFKLRIEVDNSEGHKALIGYFLSEGYRCIFTTVYTVVQVRVTNLCDI